MATRPSSMADRTWPGQTLTLVTAVPPTPAGLYLAITDLTFHWAQRELPTPRATPAPIHFTRLITLTGLPQLPAHPGGAGTESHHLYQWGGQGGVGQPGRRLDRLADRFGRSDQVVNPVEFAAGPSHRGFGVCDHHGRVVSQFVGQGLQVPSASAQGKGSTEEYSHRQCRDGGDDYGQYPGTVDRGDQDLTAYSEPPWRSWSHRATRSGSAPWCDGR
jgi:hypothetical protein